MSVLDAVKKEFIPWDPLYYKYSKNEAGEWIAIDSETHLCPECGKEYRKVMDKLLHRNV